MEWMGKQNYPSANNDCYQRQRFCSRAITRFVRNPLFGQDWFIIELTDSDSYSYSYQFWILSLFSLIMKSATSKRRLALFFVYIAKCLRKWAAVRLETNKYEQIVQFQANLWTSCDCTIWIPSEIIMIKNYRCVWLERRFSVGQKRGKQCK